MEVVKFNTKLIFIEDEDIILSSYKFMFKKFGANKKTGPFFNCGKEAYDYLLEYSQAIIVVE